MVPANTIDDPTRREFLPAALEVQETPPSPAGRWLLGVLLTLFVIGLLWASIGQVDIVVTAPGRIVPSGQVKWVQAPSSGTVAGILVSEGDRVEAGQALIRLDATYADADDRRIRERMHDIAVQVAWRQGFENWLADGWDVTTPVQLPLHFAAADQARAQALYRQHRVEAASRLVSMQKELAANRAEEAGVRAEADRTRAILAVLDERLAAYKTLLDKQYGARVQYLEVLQQQTELERAIPVLAYREQRLGETAAGIAARLNATASELRKQNLLELARLHGERRAMAQDSRKARQQRHRQLLTAPVAGTVQELAIHTVGGVVSPAQALMKIVPDDAGVEVEAYLQNLDIGFVDEGQPAEIKIDTFNFTKYGLIDAVVIDVSNDAVEDQRLGWVFKLRLQLERDNIAVEEKLVTLSPGMAITAEIKTGRRRLIEFFLSPLLRYGQESVRER